MLSLRSATTEILFWTIAGAVFIAVIVYWVKLSPPRWWSLLTRALSLIFVITFSVLAVGVSMNREYAWYSSWSDLVSANEVATSEVTAGATAGNAAPSAAPPTKVVETAKYPTNAALGIAEGDKPSGQWLTIKVAGETSGVTSEVWVWLPASYTSPGTNRQLYPVIMALHGYPGIPADYAQGIALGDKVTAAVAASQMKESIIIAPGIAGPGGVDSECVNGNPGQPQMETFLATDLPKWIKTNFRASSDPQSWATFGFSEGGYCAAMLAMLHPKVFSAGVEFAGYSAPQFEKGYKPFAVGSEQYNKYDLVKLAQNAPPPVSLRVMTSKADALSWSYAKALMAAVKPPTSVTAAILTGVGHRMQVWVKDMPNGLDWLGQHISGFKPGPYESY